MLPEPPEDRGWLNYMNHPQVAQGDVLRVVNADVTHGSGAEITQVEIFADAVRISWRDLEPADRSRPIAIGEQDHPHWRISDCAGVGFRNVGGSFSRETIDGVVTETGSCTAATLSPQDLTEVQLTDGTRTMSLRLR